MKTPEQIFNQEISKGRKVAKREEQTRIANNNEKMETNQKVWESPNIKRTQYHTKGVALDIEYNNGNIYQYLDVPVSIWDKMIETDNIGKFVAENLKGHFRYVHINGE